MLLDSDIVKFAVGTRINEAHQDPNIPVELDLRRNIVKRIADASGEQLHETSSHPVPLSRGFPTQGVESIFY
jgi:hypothetical protein